RSPRRTGPARGSTRCRAPSPRRRAAGRTRRRSPTGTAGTAGRPPSRAGMPSRAAAPPPSFPAGRSPLLVDLRRVEDAPADDLPAAAAGLVFAVEATVVAVVARRPDLLDVDQDDVRVTVGADRLH